MPGCEAQDIPTWKEFPVTLLGYVFNPFTPGPDRHGPAGCEEIGERTLLADPNYCLEIRLYRQSFLTFSKL